MYVHWHRRDLRATDNAGLAAATAGGERVVPLFVFDDAVLDHAAPPRVRFLLDALASLRSWYRERGSDLLVARGDPREIVPSVASEYDATTVTWGQDYSGLARDRDDAVRRALEENGIDHRAPTDWVLHEPGTITTTEGDHYSVYSYYWKKWRDRPKTDPYDAPDSAALADVDGEPLPSIDDLGIAAPEASIPAASPAAARDRLDAFCDGPIFAYEDRREDPAADATSRLSPHLKFGTIGVRTVYAATSRAMANATGEDADSVETFRSELAWRDFYAQVLAANPETVTENHRTFEGEIDWRNEPDELAAWKAGETGYPIVDAGMRQLRQEAFLHNRLRMIVASFLTKDLLVDWRHGYDWFRERLVDHDTASDVGGWQWAASTGTDAQPYFRVFNPTTQGERYDPDAEYVRQYVPELRDVPAEDVHQWPDLSEERRDSRAPEYPHPIVDHAGRRELAIETFERARKG